MEQMICDYLCRTVGEGVIKYNIPDDWCAEFDAYDDIYPTVAIPISRLRKTSALMDLNLRMIENEEEELAGCVVMAEHKIIAFKIPYIRDFVTAMQLETQ